MRELARILVVFIALIFLGSCFENPDCLGLRNNLVGISFKKLFDGQPDTVGFFGISVSGSDSTFFPLTATSWMALPLNNSSKEETITFNSTQGLFTMSVNYEAQTQFEDVECGPRIILSNLGVTGHDFDSLRTINPTPFSTATSPSDTNIEVYRCPYTNFFKLGFRQWLADDNADGTPLEEPLNGVSVDYLPSVFYAGEELSSVVLPLNLNNAVTQVTIDHAIYGLSNLSVTYARQPVELFNVCGSQTLLSNLQVFGGASYDKLTLTKDSITDPPSTNVLLFRCPKTNLIELQLQNAAGEDASFSIDRVTTSYTAEEFFNNETTSVLVLPLDENSDQTDFTIHFEAGPREIHFGYLRTMQTFHEQCDQTIFSSLEILFSDFSSPPVIVSDSVQFPTVANVEIINN